MNIQTAAQQYCNIRILIGAISTIVIALISIYYAINIERYLGDTSFYKTVSGKIIGGSVEESIRRRGSRSYSIVLNVEYNIDGKIYKTTKNQSSIYNSRNQAQNNLNNSIGKTEIVNYNPNDPSQTVDVIDQENSMAYGIGVFALFMIASAIFAIVFRKNPIFCGITIAGDTASVIRNAVRY
jgi:hypothetical protein